VTGPGRRPDSSGGKARTIPDPGRIVADLAVAAAAAWLRMLARLPANHLTNA